MDTSAEQVIATLTGLGYTGIEIEPEGDIEMIVINNALICSVEHALLLSDAQLKELVDGAS